MTFRDVWRVFIEFVDAMPPLSPNEARARVKLQMDLEDAQLWRLHDRLIDMEIQRRREMNKPHP